MRAKNYILGAVLTTLIAVSSIALAQVSDPDSGNEAQPPVQPGSTAASSSAPAAPDRSQDPPPPDPVQALPQDPQNPPQPEYANPGSQIEDQAIETPSQTRIEWVPPEDAGSLAPPRGAAKRPGRPRKMLSDAGEASSWSDNGGMSAEALSERSPRRERPVDPLKRSDLTGLARTLGSLHALRVACGGRDDQTWRSRMATLLDMEAPSGGQLRDPLVDAFNAGFSVQGRGAAPCPGDARLQEANLAREGRRLSLQMAARYRPAAPAAAPAAQGEQDRSDRPALQPGNPADQKNVTP
jgi:uncharacterized protein (TIGR02301 family)